MRMLMFFLLLSSAPALAAEHYDLACQGSRITQRSGPAEAYATRFRIDLTANKWCQDACEKVSDIAEVAADKIVLVDDLTYNSRTDFSNNITIDRKTGALRQLSSQDRPTTLYLKVEASCTEQPFTPFP